ncbi:hypothetical protein [Actinokineospora inagensis]|nr:hypothetical protein [Actinokineospora inagensis]
MHYRDRAIAIFVFRPPIDHDHRDGYQRRVYNWRRHVDVGQ